MCIKNQRLSYSWKGSLMFYPLDKLLYNYTPSDTWEQECKERMLAFMKEHSDCFKRSLDIGHFTGSAWILNHDKNHALLTHHTKLDKWLQLGGHCDGDPDILQVALKEAQEESGIEDIVPLQNDIFDIDIHLIPPRGDRKEHYHYDVRFLLQAVGNDSLIQNHESKELRWISKNREELPTTSRSIIRMFDKWLSI